MVFCKCDQSTMWYGDFGVEQLRSQLSNTPRLPPRLHPPWTQHRPLHNPSREQQDPHDPLAFLLAFTLHGLSTDLFIILLESSKILTTPSPSYSPSPSMDSAPTSS